MRIAFLTPNDQQEGLSEYSQMLVNALTGLAEEVEVEVLNSNTIYLQSQLRLVNNGHFDLVHIQHELAHWGSFTNPFRSRFFEFCQQLEVPKVVTFHTIDLKGEAWKKWGWWGKRRFLQMHKLPQASIVHTKYSKEGLVRMGVPSSKIHVIPIGIPNVNLKLKTQSSRLQLKAQSLKEDDVVHKRVIAVFGFINPDKGYEIVWNALPDLPLDIVCVIAGGVQDQSNQTYLNSLKSLIAQKNLQNRVVITGFLKKEEMLDLMCQTEIVLFPRTHVNASLELSLAIAFQRPILTSNLPYFMEVYARVPCLEIFKLEGDRNQNFRKKLLQLLENRKCQQMLSRKCTEYAQAYSWEEIAKETVDVYKSVL